MKVVCQSIIHHMNLVTLLKIGIFFLFEARHVYIVCSFSLFLVVLFCFVLKHISLSLNLVFKIACCFRQPLGC